jgi:hypothetical protein
MSEWHFIELMWAEYGAILLAVIASIVIQQRRLKRFEERLCGRLGDGSGLGGKITSLHATMKAGFDGIHADFEAEMDRRWPNRLKRPRRDGQ